MDMNSELHRPVFSRFLKPSGELPVMSSGEAQKFREYVTSKAVKGVIMVDLDRNLTGENYQLTDEGVIELIKEVQNKGYFVCLNSSRSAKKLESWQKKLGTHFPNFSENGLILDINDSQEGINMQVATDHRAFAFNEKFKTLAIAELKERLSEKYQNANVRFCEDKEFSELIEDEKAAGHWNDGGQYGILINRWNKVKTTMYAFKKNGDRGDFDGEFAKVVKGALKEIGNLVDSKRSITIKNYSDDCSIITHPVNQNKTWIWKILFSYLGTDKVKGLKFYHLGDGKEDYIQDGRVTVLGPGNSRPELRARKNEPDKKTEFAPDELIYTKGVIWHLINIIDGKYD